MERLLQLVKGTEGIEALTFREAVERYPEAIRYWLHWRNETATQKWNELFHNRRFHRIRMLHRYWRDLTDKSVDWLEDWLADAYCAALAGDLEGMERALSERSKLLFGGRNPLGIVRWFPILANAAVRKLNHHPPTKMEDAFQVIISPVVANIAVNSQPSIKHHASRSLVYLSFDQNLVFKHVAATSKALVKRGWRVIVVHPHGAPWDSEPKGLLRIEVGRKSEQGIRKWVNWLRVQMEMAKLIATWRPPVIYARQHWLGLLPPLIARRLGIPYIAEFNGLRHRGILSRNPRSVKGLIIRQLERWCVQWSSSIVVPSLSLAKRIAELLGNNPTIQNLSPFTPHALRITHHESRITLHASRLTIFIIPNGIDPEIFRPIPQVEARQKLGLPTDGLYVVYAGGLYFWQGVDVLIHAFARLVKKFSNCRLLIVGGQDEPNKDAYKRLAHELRITDHTIFVPFVPYEQSALYIAAADVCVAPYVPSYCEHGGGSPLKLYAYLSCGRPVVLSDLGEFVDADLVRVSRAGLLVPPGDPEALAEAIGQLLSNPALCSEMGQRGREAILNGYTWDHNAERYSGQMCTAPQNILVPATGVETPQGRWSAEEFAERLRAAIDALVSNEKLGPPTLGAIQNERTLERVRQARALGLPIVRDSAPIAQPGFPNARTATPLVLWAEAPRDAQIYGREWFGPISFLVRVPDVEAGITEIARLVRTAGALVCSLYCSEEALQQRALQELAESGVPVALNFTGPVWINQSAAYSDFHGTGLTPAGTASFTDLAYVSARFGIVGIREVL
jgi:glycosyltransferase involved in cell wall biosynthesis